MVKKEITEAELLKMKLEINEEQQKARHQQNNSIQKAILLADEAKTDITLLSQLFDTMKDDIKEIKEIVKEGFKEVGKKFEDLPHKFATKDEHKQNSNRLDKIEKAMIRVIGLILSIVIATILYKAGIGIK